MAGHRNIPNGAPGPPTALTDATHEAIVQATRAGAYGVHAAGYAGIAYDTLRRWRRIGESEPPQRDDYVSDLAYEKAADHHRRCVELTAAMKNAEARFAVENLVTIRSAAATSWQAAAWLNERRFKDLYALRAEVTGPGGEPVKIEAHTIEQMLSDPVQAQQIADRSVDATADPGVPRQPGRNGDQAEPG